MTWREAYRPDLILISAGYDAHRADPLADCMVTEAGYAAMTATMRRVCRGAGAPLGVVLEGGYALDALAGSVAATMEVLAAEEAPGTGRSTGASGGSGGPGAAGPGVTRGEGGLRGLLRGDGRDVLEEPVTSAGAF